MNCEPERYTQHGKDFFSIEHRFGGNEDYGDHYFVAEARGEFFELSGWTVRGRSDCGRDTLYRELEDMKLNEDEARDLWLALTAWLETRG